MKKVVFFIIALFIISFSIISAPFGYDNPTLPQLKEETFDDYTSDFFMPLNTSVFGNFSFNGGWGDGGFSIIDGDIYAQTGYFYNLTSLNITKANLTILEDAYFLGNVGIGTVSPSGKLHIEGNLYVDVDSIIRNDGTYGGGMKWAGDGAQTWVYGSSGAGGYVYLGAGNKIYVYDSDDSDTVRMEFDTATGNMQMDGTLSVDGTGDSYINGNIGIGTTSPNSRFEVARVAGENEVNLSGVFYLNSTSGNVGIGTAGPDALLNILTISNATIDNSLRLVNTGIGLGTGNRLSFSTKQTRDHAFIQSQYLDATTYHNLEFGTGGWGNDVDGTVKMVILGDGNIGIGTTSPSELLHLQKDNADVPIIFTETDGQNWHMGIDYDGYNTDSFTIGRGGSIGTTDDIVIERSNGNIGIGTTSPFIKFHTYVNDTSLVTARLEQDSTGDAVLGFTLTDTQGYSIGIDNDNNNNFKISEGGAGVRTTPRITVQRATGNVGIGTTNPQQKLNVVGTSNFTENATFEKDVIIDGTLFGGSPVKIAGINITDNLFSLKEDLNSSSRFTLENINSGTNATAVISAINDVGGSMSIGIGSSNFMLGDMDSSNITALFSKARGDMYFANFFKEAFVWLYNPQDDNDPNNLVEIMRLDENGLNLSGNFTGNQYYAEMWFHNDSVDGNPTTISAQDTWYNITGFSQATESGQTLNGFSFSGHKLTCQISGLYKIDYSISFGGGLNDEYKTAVGVNGISQGNTETHRKLGAGGDVGNTGSGGFVILNTNDVITLMILNDDAIANADVHSASINLVRIGN